MEEPFGIDCLLTEISHIVYCWRWKEKSGNINPQWTFIHPHLLTINHPITVHSHSQSPRCHPFQPIKIQNPPFQISIPLNRNPHNLHHHSSTKKNQNKKKTKTQSLTLPRNFFSPGERKRENRNKHRKRKKNSKTISSSNRRESVSHFLSPALEFSGKKSLRFSLIWKFADLVDCSIRRRRRRRRRRRWRGFSAWRKIKSLHRRLTTPPIGFLTFLSFLSLFFIFYFLLFNYCCVWFRRKK